MSEVPLLSVDPREAGLEPYPPLRNHTLHDLLDAGTHLIVDRYRGTSLIRESAALGFYSRTMPSAFCWS